MFWRLCSGVKSDRNVNTDKLLLWNQHQRCDFSVEFNIEYWVVTEAAEWFLHDRWHLSYVKVSCITAKVRTHTPRTKVWKALTRWSDEERRNGEMGKGEQKWHETDTFLLKDNQSQKANFDWLSICHFVTFEKRMITGIIFRDFHPSSMSSTFCLTDNITEILNATMMWKKKKRQIKDREWQKQNREEKVENVCIFNERLVKKEWQIK